MHLLEIPYERQQENWTCAAAALCMVYRSFGLDAGQAELWPHIRSAHADRHRRGARPPALVRHACEQGLAALALCAARPWQLLRRCFQPDLRVIIFPRRGYDSFGLHAAVLRGLDEDGVVLHDPYGRPDRELARDDFLALWGPHLFATLAQGYLLVVVARPPLARVVCACGGPVPDAVVCPLCQGSIPLVPAVSGCGRIGCPDRDWHQLHCPHCEGLVSPSSPE